MQRALQDYRDFIEYIRETEATPVMDRAVQMADTFERKCSAFTAHQAQPMERKFPVNGSVYSIGDIHADYCTFVICLKLAGVLAGVLNTSFTRLTPISRARWIGGDSLVIQTGDLIGGECKKCECGYGDTEEHNKAECISFMRIMKLIEVLNRQADDHGGAIVTLYGNHELRHVLAYNELITDHSSVRLRSHLPPDADITPSKKKKCRNKNKACPFFQYAEDGENDEWEQLSAPPKILKHTHANEITQSGPDGYASHQRLFQPGGLMSNYLGCASTPILFVGDWMFLHGGVIERFLDHPVFRSIRDDRRKLIFYNMLIRDYVLADDKESFFFLTPGDRENYFDDLLDETGDDRTAILSPVWNNRYGVKLKKRECDNLDGPLERLKIGQMVVGHVPQHGKKISPSQLAKPNRHADYQSTAHLKGGPSINVCATARGNKVFRTDVAMGFRNCKNRAQLMKITRDGTVSYLANRSSNRQDPDAFVPVEKVIIRSKDY